MANGQGLSNLGQALSNITGTLADMQYREQQAEAERIAAQREQEREASINTFTNNLVSSALTYKRQLVGQGLHPGAAEVKARKHILRNAASQGIDANKALTMFNKSTQQAETSTTGGIQTTRLPGAGGLQIETIDAVKALSYINPDKRDEAITKFQSGDAQDQQEATNMALNGVVNNERLKLLNSEMTAKMQINKWNETQFEQKAKPELINSLSNFTEGIIDKEFKDKSELNQVISRLKREYMNNLYDEFDIVTDDMVKIVDDYFNTTKEALSNTRLSKIKVDRDIEKNLIDLQNYALQQEMPEDVRRMMQISMSNPQLLGVMATENVGVEKLFQSVSDYMEGVEFPDIRNKRWENIIDVDKMSSSKFRAALVRDLYENNITNKAELRNYIQSTGEYSDDDVKEIMDLLEESYSSVTGRSFLDQLNNLKTQ